MAPCMEELNPGANGTLSAIQGIIAVLVCSHGRLSRCTYGQVGGIYSEYGVLASCSYLMDLVPRVWTSLLLGPPRGSCLLSPLEADP